MSLPDINAADRSTVKIVLLSMHFGCPEANDWFDTVEEALRTGDLMVEYNTAEPCAVVVDGVVKYCRSGDPVEEYNGTWCTSKSEDDLEFVKKHWPGQLVKEIT